ncbi:hypothetical protein JG687_00007149 [Phytophthora cactorum]|uniref:Uncharacterized protein n=1 Tax=Phytophthora cactorum TaxID=29920 RepID=A0A8T1UHQ1_9STRA|nr:hypothetical protein JG687_00007149 [Phytophthora cactorum]
MADSVIKTDDSSPGCENARVEWGKKMLNRHSLHCSNVLFEISIEMGCPRVGTFDNNGATSGSPLTRSAALVPSTDQRSQSSTHEKATSATSAGQISIPPPAKDWKDMDQMYWTADAARHLFKPVSECKSLERKKSDVLPSRSSVAKLIAEDVRAFTIQKGTLSPRNAADSTLSTYAAYYTEHWLKDTAELNVLTIDTLARYIRF